MLSSACPFVRAQRRISCKQGERLAARLDDPTSSDVHACVQHGNLIGEKAYVCTCGTYIRVHEHVHRKTDRDIIRTLIQTQAGAPTYRCEYTHSYIYACRHTRAHTYVRFNTGGHRQRTARTCSGRVSCGHGGSAMPAGKQKATRGAPTTP